MTLVKNVIEAHYLIRKQIQSLHSSLLQAKHLLIKFLIVHRAIRLSFIRKVGPTKVEDSFVTNADNLKGKSERTTAKYAVGTYVTTVSIKKGSKAGAQTRVSQVTPLSATRAILLSSILREEPIRAEYSFVTNAGKQR